MSESRSDCKFDRSVFPLAEKQAFSFDNNGIDGFLLEIFDRFHNHQCCDHRGSGRELSDGGRVVGEMSVRGQIGDQGE